MRKSALFWYGLIITTLVAVGLLVLSSASVANSIKYHNDAYHFMQRQAGFIAGGIVIAVCVALFDYRRWRDNVWLSWLFYAAVFVALIWVFNCRVINGSQRWIQIHGINIFQPSECAKLVTVILVAAWLDRLGWKVELFWQGAFWPSVFIAGLALPIVFQPDFGSVMVVGLVGYLMMFVSGVRIVHMIPFALLGGAFVAFKVLTNANRVARLFDADALYQVKNALAAIGSGGIWGVGMGESMQKQFYLPEAHTDFVFAIGAEEFGLFFSIGVLFLYCSFFALSVYIARKAADRFGRFLVMGMTFIVFFQAMFNLGVVCNALPTKGMALPFFSYGGTNMLCSFFAIGTIMSVGIHTLRAKNRTLARKVLSRA